LYKDIKRKIFSVFSAVGQIEYGVSDKYHMEKKKPKLEDLSLQLCCLHPTVGAYGRRTKGGY